MKVKRIIIPLILLLFLFFLLKGYRLRSFEETLQAAVAPHGYTVTVKKAWVKVNGKVYFRHLVLSDSQGSRIVVEEGFVHSSLFGLWALQQRARKGTLTSTAIAKKIKKAHFREIKGSYQTSSVGLFTVASLSLHSRGNKLLFNATIPHLEHGDISLTKGLVRGEMQESVVRVQSALFQTMGGALTLDVVISTFKRVEEFSVTFNNLEISNLLHSQKIQGRCFGTFSLDTFSLDKLDKLQRLYGTGTIEVKEFSQHGERRFNTALNKLRRLGIRQLNFNTIHGAFELRNGRMISDNITFRNDDYRLEARGRYRLKKKSFNYKIDGYLQPHMQSRMKSVVWGALLHTETKERKFTGAVRGVPDKYVVTVDGKFIKRGINSFFNNIFH